MQRLFAFDPGTAALGWSVIEVEDGTVQIRACGVRLYGLARQRILEMMKQRLKPQDRVKARRRRRMRLRKLDEILQASGLIAKSGTSWWKSATGSDLRKLIEDAPEKKISGQSLVRLIHNVHRNRGNRAFGPYAIDAKAYLERILSVQAQWHPALSDHGLRTRIHDAVFYMRPRKAQNLPEQPHSRLASLAANELMRVRHGLVAEFGQADLTVIEAAVAPNSGKRQPAGDADAAALDLLLLHGFPATPRRLLKARLFLRQAPNCGKTAICALTGQSFTFDDAMSEAIEIDHDLPKSRGGPGGRANLRLVLAHANRSKGAGPVSAGTVSRNPAGILDSDSLRQSLSIVRSRFETLAIPKKLAFVSSRSLAALREALVPRFGTKDRSNQLHHVADAVIAGLAAIPCGRAMLPDDLSTKLETALKDARLSVRRERSLSGRLHEDTRYGLPAAESGFDPKSHVVTRKAVECLTPAMMRRIADPALRCKALSWRGADNAGNAGPFARTKRVKIAVPAAGHIRLHDSEGVFKAAVLPADNHHMDIVQMRDGSWKTFTVTRHERNQPGWRPEWEINRLGGKLVMRLHKGDMIEWSMPDGSRELLVVARLNGSSGILHLARPFGDSGSGELVAVAASTLRKRQAKAVEATPCGLKRNRRSNTA